MNKKKIPFLGLVMIVKNESHIICEALESVVSYIDTYVISDTGSTDNTPTIIKDFFEKHNIQGHVFDDEWEDFGTNRSIVLKHAKNKMKIAFMLDADDLFVKPNLSKSDIHKLLDVYYDGYKIGITNEQDSVFYWRVQVFNLKRDWKFKGVLHEYPTFDTRENYQSKMLELPLKICSRRLGNRNKMDIIEKYQKDSLTLENALKKDPLNERYMFYLGQSYRDCKNYVKSIEWYQKRADFGGWPEEVYYSLYQIGNIYLHHLKDENLGKQYCLKAFKYRSTRIESMNTLIQYYKSIKEYYLAYIYNQKKNIKTIGRLSEIKYL
jgi:glycosyltransferase involved in cell wall biosynthesis